MSISPSIIPVQDCNQSVSATPAQVSGLPAPLPPGLPTPGVFDSLFCGLPGGAFIGRYWWILLLVFFLFIKPGIGSSIPRPPLRGGFLWVLILLFLLYPQFFAKLGFKR